MKLLLMADGKVGFEVVSWLLANYSADIGLVVTIARNRIYDRANELRIPVVVFQSDAQIVDELTARATAVDIGLLVWWPHIVRQPLFEIPEHGFINTHPSLLPHNRGKHYNFWALVEQAPFGVSLHVVSAAVDGGDVVAQASIAYSWEDTGESMFSKAQAAMVALVKRTYPCIRALQFERSPQPINSGSFHFARELEPASIVELDREYSARDLLNRLRARTFSGHPSCWFSDEGAEYEVRVEIRKREREGIR